LTSAPEDASFNSEVAGIVGGGVATLFLAVFTAILALSTRTLAEATKQLGETTASDTRATEQLVKIAQEDQRRAIEPIVVATSEVIARNFRGQRASAVKAELRNIGRGTALDLAVSVYHLPGSGVIDQQQVHYATRIVALEPSEVLSIVIELKEEWNLAEPIYVGGTCKDSSERERLLTFGFHNVPRRRDG
jgi:hypothetical protein